MTTKIFHTFAALFCIGSLLYFSTATPPEEKPNKATGLALTHVMGAAQQSGFHQAIQPRLFQFPADHGPHPTFKQEWWYVTGNVSSEQPKRDFGFQWTLFRVGLTATPPLRPSAWATSEIYMGHLAVTDIQSDQFYPAQKLARPALQMAGAQANPFRAWIENWQLVQKGGEPNKPILQLSAQTDLISLELTLEAIKEVVLQGDQGLSQKNSQPGNASYYYSLPRLKSTGTLAIKGQTFTVNGLSWMDREWSTSALAADQVGWDWFSLHLSDGSDLIYYQIRNQEGKADPVSQGALIDSDGNKRVIRASDIQLTVLNHWTSPTSHSVYPSGWKLVVPGLNLSLILTPAIKNQELNQTLVTYWEGAVTVDGVYDGKKIGGKGYGELTGYDR
ncbi:MAG: carotenoid 1,2-hydratase [Magnetococcales bacterium]|nr:carotenoid 1,2-hydratase [Magnetococcales bacterium]